MRPRLASFEHAWANAAFDTIYPAPPVSTLPHGIASMHPARFFDDVLGSIPLEQSLGLRMTLWMIALAPLFTIRRLGTIASISPEDRVRVLEVLITSRIYVVRQLAMSFKAIATLLYAQSDLVRAAMTTPVQGLLANRPIEPAAADLISAARLTSRGKKAEHAERAAQTGGSHDHAA